MLTSALQEASPATLGDYALIRDGHTTVLPGLQERLMPKSWRTPSASSAGSSTSR